MTKRAKKIPLSPDRAPEPETVECADGEYRPNWKSEDHRLTFLIPPGTPIIECTRGCGQRVCMVKGAVGHFAVEYENAEGHPLYDFYAPKHFNCE